MTEDKKLDQQEELDDAILDEVTGGADDCTKPRLPPILPTPPNPWLPPKR